VCPKAVEALKMAIYAEFGEFGCLYTLYMKKAEPLPTMLLALWAIF
jgi:hypothetical protein